MSLKRPEGAYIFTDLLARREKELGGRMRCVGFPRAGFEQRTYPCGRRHRPEYSVSFEDGQRVGVPARSVHEDPLAAFDKVRRARKKKGKKK